VKSPKNQDAACRKASGIALLRASNTPAEEAPNPLMSLWSVATQSIPAPGAPLASGEPLMNTKWAVGYGSVRLTSHRAQGLKRACGVRRTSWISRHCAALTPPWMLMPPPGLKVTFPLKSAGIPVIGSSAADTTKILAAAKTRTANTRKRNFLFMGPPHPAHLVGHEHGRRDPGDD
jgi:hypothetical protein